MTSQAFLDQRQQLEERDPAMHFDAGIRDVNAIDEERRIAREPPRDPALFIDGIHISYPGIKMHGWITFLQLLPLVEKRLAGHVATRAASDDGGLAFSTITVAEIQERLSAGALTLPLPPLGQWRPGSPAVRLKLDSTRLLVEGTNNRWAYQVVSP